MAVKSVDCLVIGAGPAGMTAATYLARFRRSVVVADDADSRASWIPVSHNIPGFAGGLAGPDLLRRHREQLSIYGIVPRKGRIQAAQAREAGAFQLTLEREDGTLEAIPARTVLLATGVRDTEPPLADIGAAIRNGLVRICPVCDGYEARDQNIAVLGDGPSAVSEAVFVRTFSRRVTLLLCDGEESLSPDDRRTLAEAGVDVVNERVAAVRAEAGDTIVVSTTSGRERRFDTLYSALGTRANSDLAVMLGAKVEASCRAILVDDHQRTTVPGLWAAGDVVSRLNQVSVAWGQAAVAATDIHNHLRQQS